MNCHFYKYHGAGNDFIIIDNRKGFFDKTNAKLIAFLCHRRFGIGADGLITLEKSAEFDFHMSYFNSDGYEASMCGNGGRCIVAFANKLGIISGEANFIAADGPHQAFLSPNDNVRLQMLDVENVSSLADGYFLNTGVPHLVCFVNDLKMVDVDIEGRQLRFDARFQPEGTNVNFVKQKDNQLTVYTYERGVESETLACGTGITASALSAAYKTGKHEGNFRITAKGGKLDVSFKREGDRFTDIWLTGPACLVFEGNINLDEINFNGFE